MGEDHGLPQLSQPTIAAVLELWRDGRRPFTLRIEGQSMLPLAVPGDRVSIQPVSPDQLRCGDIVALQTDESLVVHRLLQARADAGGTHRLCQKGDNSPAWSWIAGDSLLGRVDAVHGLERTLHLSRRPWTWINPLVGRLGHVGRRAHRLSRLLIVPLVHIGLRFSR